MSAARTRALAAWNTPILLALGVAGVALLGSAGGFSLEQTTTTGLIYVVATVGFYVFVGNSGVFSFGHVAFMAIGAYTGALLTVPVDQKSVLIPALPHAVASAHVSPLAGCAAGGLVAALVAALASLPLMRLSGIAASLTTFALLGIVYNVESHWEQLTNGLTGIVGIPQTTDVMAALIWAVGAIFAAFWVQRSSWGMRLRASREDEVAARAIGIGIHWERRYAFTLSAGLMGVAGALYAQQLGTLTPDTVYLDVTFLIVVMLVVGGSASLTGAVTGSVFITVVSEILRRIEEGAHVGPVFLNGPSGLREVGLALVMLIGLALRPNGLVGTREVVWPRNWRASAAVRRLPARVPVDERPSARGGRP